VVGDPTGRSVVGTVVVVVPVAAALRVDGGAISVALCTNCQLQAALAVEPGCGTGANAFDDGTESVLDPLIVFPGASSIGWNRYS